MLGKTNFEEILKEQDTKRLELEELAEMNNFIKFATIEMQKDFLWTVHEMQTILDHSGMSHLLTHPEEAVAEMAKLNYVENPSGYEKIDITRDINYAFVTQAQDKLKAVDRRNNMHKDKIAYIKAKQQREKRNAYNNETRDLRKTNNNNNNNNDNNELVKKVNEEFVFNEQIRHMKKIVAVNYKGQETNGNGTYKQQPMTAIITTPNKMITFGNVVGYKRK